MAEADAVDYDAFTFTLNKLFSKNWLMQASYTWSSLRGNYPGLFRTEDGQLDPNLTSEYDLVSLLGNKTGPLGGNRNNQIKVAGSYTAMLSPDVTLVPSVNFQAFSGHAGERLAPSTRSTAPASPTSSPAAWRATWTGRTSSTSAPRSSGRSRVRTPCSSAWTSSTS